MNKELVNLVRNSDAILITAGAGMGVDSGLPDFRGNQGFWKAYPPIEKLGISFSEMANPTWFDTKPSLAWAFYGHRLNLYRKTTPHIGFKFLLDYGNSLPGGYFVFTSNVDGQFQKAGFDENRIEEVHGSIHHFQCSRPCSDKIWSANEIEVNVDESSFTAINPLPVCPSCGSVARPNILMFGDWGWLHKRSSNQSDKLEEWLNYLKRNSFRLLIVEIGAGLSVPTVRYKSEQIANLFEAKLVRINPVDYQVPFGHFSINMGAKDGIETLLKYF